VASEQENIRCRRVEGHGIEVRERIQFFRQRPRARGQHGPCNGHKKSVNGEVIMCAQVLSSTALHHSLKTMPCLLLRVLIAG
jgi:hypothetical protein